MTFPNIGDNITDNYQFDPLRGTYYKYHLLYCPPPPISTMNINSISSSFTNSPWNIDTIFRLQISFNTVDYSDFDTNSLNYTIIPNPTFTKLSPTIGPVQGGTLVSIFGSNFDAIEIEHLYCKFGDKQRVAVVAKNESAIQCYSAYSETPRIAYVYVYYKDNIIHHDGLLTFEYYPELIITDIYPYFGPKSGGTEISIYGQNFLQNTIKCYIENTTIYTFTPTYISRTLLKFIMPPYSSLALPHNNTNPVIECSNNNGANYYKWNRYFRFMDDITMTSLIPTYGPELGQTRVTIKGSGFFPFHI